MKRAPIAVLALLLGAVAPPLSGQGITFGAGPEASIFRWDDELGLDDATLYGVRATVEFGRYVALGAGWSAARELDVRFDPARFSAPDGRADLDLFSTDLRLRLGSGAIAPLLLGGGGIARFSPEDRETTEEIFVSWGAGLELRAGPGAAQFSLQDTRFRVDRGLLSGLPAPGPDPDADHVRRHLRASLSVALRLGGRPATSRTGSVDDGVAGALRGNFDGLLIPIEARAGLVRFAPGLDLDEQTTAGLRAGVDFGPYFGLRGSWFRDVGDSEGGVEMRGLFGEAQFNVGRVTSATPFLLLGYGVIDFASDAVNRAGNPVADQDVVVVGGGFGFPLAERARLTVAVRDYISATGEPGVPSSPSDLRHSPAVDVGLSILAFGRRSGAGEASDRPGARGGAASAAAGASAERPAGGAAGEPSEAAGPSYQSDRVVTLPVPTEGELYVRYGPGRSGEVGLPLDSLGRLDAAALREMIRSEILALGSDSTATPELRAIQLRLDELAARSGTSSEVDASIRELSGIVRETVSLSPTIVTAVNVSGGAGGAGGASGGFFQGVQLRTGTSSFSDTGPGLGLSAEALVLNGDDGMLQPYLGVEYGRASVRTTLGESSVIGRTRSLSVRTGFLARLPRVGPLRPHLMAGTAAVSGRNDGRADQDDELLDELYATRRVGIEWGAQVALGEPDERWNLVGAVRRLSAGSRSRWAIEVGARWSPSRSEAPEPDSALVARMEASEQRLLDRLDRLEAALDAAPAVGAPVDSVRSPDPVTVPPVADPDPVDPTVEEQPAVAVEPVEVPAEAPPSVDARLAEVVQAPWTELREEGRGIVLEVTGEAFSTGSWILGEDPRAAVTAVARILRTLDGWEFVVEGHTDAVGDPVRNQELSLRRAEQVRSVLLASGISPSRVQAIGSGSAAPRASNEDAEGRAANRRVEILLIPPGA